MAKNERPESLGKQGCPRENLLKPAPHLKPGSILYPAKPKNLEYLSLNNAHAWSPLEEDWKLPQGWHDIVIRTFRDRLEKSRSLKVFLESCVRCGACADKCPFFLGTADPRNMPVIRAELLRSVYRGELSNAGKILKGIVGARKLTPEVIKEWYAYFYRCSECRRCSLFCPFGIDTAEITMLARELLLELGIAPNWVIEPIANCFRTGNHLGIQPHGMKESLEFLAEEVESLTGIKIEVPINKKGAKILFVVPSADYFAEPGIYTCMGYLMLFHEIGLDYTFSTYASDGGNFGLFASFELMKRLNAKVYAEAKRLKVDWILGGECGHMWRVWHQYMDTMNGPPNFLRVPASSVTGTVFEHARSTKALHICEFTADLIHENKLRLDPSRNHGLVATFHDSCNIARAMGMFAEPRYILEHAIEHFVEMPSETIREKTFCCGSGAGLGAEENIEVRLKGGFPRGNAVRFVRDANGVNVLCCICAIDRATLPTVCEYWAKGVEVYGLHELLGNALVMRGEKPRTKTLRGEPLPEGKGPASGV